MLRASVFALAVLALPLLSAGQDAGFWINKGYNHSLKNELADAEACYMKALALDRNNGYAYGNLTFVFLNTNRIKQVLESADRAFELGVRGAGVYVNRAEACRRLGAQDKSYYAQGIADAMAVIRHKGFAVTDVTEKDLAGAQTILQACCAGLCDHAKNEPPPARPEGKRQR